MTGHGIRDASHQEANEAGSAMGADHNQVGMPGRRVVKYYASRVAFFD